MKVKLNFQGKEIKTEVNKGTTVKTLIEKHHEDLEIPQEAILKIDGNSILDRDIELSEDMTLEIRLAEVTYGANTVPIDDMIGARVNEINKIYGKVLNLPKKNKTLIQVNKKEVSGNYVIKTGDQIEFVKKVGHKL